VIFALAGLFTLAYLLRGFMTVFSGAEWVFAFLIGSVIFMFVGTQLAWVLRPYFHPGFMGLWRETSTLP